MIHSPVSKRVVVLPLREIEHQFDIAENNLKGVISRDPLSFNNSDSLQSFVAELKQQWASFVSASSALIDKYNGIASFEEAQRKREIRADFRVEVRQCIDIANGILKGLNYDSLSNVDVNSVIFEDSHRVIEEVEQLPSEDRRNLPFMLSQPCLQAVPAASAESGALHMQSLSTVGNAGPLFPQNAPLEGSVESIYPTTLPSVRPKTSVCGSACDNFSVSIPRISKADSVFPNLHSLAFVNSSAQQFESGGNLMRHAAVDTGIYTQSAKPTCSYKVASKQTDEQHSFFQPAATAVSSVFAPLTVSSCSALYAASNSLHNKVSHHQHVKTPVCCGYVPTSSNIQHYNIENVQPPQHLVDAATLHLLKQELFKQSSDPYDGDPRRYRSWLMLLENRMKGIKLDPLDIISVLLANTVGEPNKVIRDYLSAGAASPSAALERIWQFLNKEYGSSVKVCQSIQRKLQEIPHIRPPHMTVKLKDLVHQCRMIEANMPTNAELQIFNLSVGQKQIWSKLPDWLQRKWRSYGHKFSQDNMGALPPFQCLIDFIEFNLDEVMNPNFEITTVYKETKRSFATCVDAEDTHHEEEFFQNEASSRERVVRGDGNLVKLSERRERTNGESKCLYHDAPGHSLLDCRSFGKLKYEDKQKFAAQNRLCFRCLGNHISRNCNLREKCSKCNGNHVLLMHAERFVPIHARRNDPSKEKQSSNVKEPKNTLCSVVCGNPQSTLSCSKTVLCEIHHSSRPDKVMKVYAVIDDCSDSSYISEKVISALQLKGTEARYLLTTMESFKSEHRALVVDGLWIRGIEKDKYFSLPKLYSSSFIPGSVYEVGTPDIVKTIPHLSHFADEFVDLDRSCEPLLLLGRDSGDIIKSTYHGEHSPFVCETPLGYTLIGAPCPNSKTNNLQVKTVLRTVHEHYSSNPLFPQSNSNYNNIFKERDDDDTLALSREDQKFIDIVRNTIHVNDTGHITVSLPFKRDDVVMPSNKLAVYSRTRSTLSKLRLDSDKVEQCVSAMGKNLAAGHVERVPDEELEPLRPGNVWWLPIFAVTHPKKMKHRLVFDCSAQYGGVSLNQVLLQGPDRNNRLRGILMRFRFGQVAFGGDIESMFYNFHLPEEDKDYLRFFWYENNQPDQKIVQYRGCVHLFGNKPSPAIAHAGLKFATEHPEAQKYPDAIKYISDNIYVDDLLAACNSTSQAIENLKNIRGILQRYHIRLCKIVSNRRDVMEHFPEGDRAQLETEVDIGSPDVHRALGLSWLIDQDRFVIRVALQNKPMTRRGMLSITNSIYDPLGMVGPVVLRSKLIQRRALQRNPEEPAFDWDERLPLQFADEWQDWLQSLDTLNNVSMPRSYIPNDFGDVGRCELHTFTDASESAIGAVVYLRMFNDNNVPHVSYVISASNIVPKACISMPRSELCAALLGSQLCSEVKNELRLSGIDSYMYSDSKVVLSYISNAEKRFSKYVSHRVSAILKLTKTSQWNYINTMINPADVACRPHTPQALMKSVWFRGPDFLWTVGDGWRCSLPEPPENLPEVLEERVAARSDKSDSHPIDDIAERVSSLSRAIGVMRVVLKFCNTYLQRSRPASMSQTLVASSKTDAVECLVIAAQRSSYLQVIEILKSDKSSRLLAGHKVASYDPFIDCNGILRVGGRLSYSYMDYKIKHPILLSHRHALSVLIIRHFHAAVNHQGRHITLGAVRAAGYFIERSSKLIKSIIDRCVFCKKLRARPEEQIMAPLPLSRLEETAPFHNTGIDVFGPFVITDGSSTRQSKGTKKMWGLLLTCMTSRAIHVEPLYGLDTSSLTNALRRFVAVRGTCKNLYSDQGTNFIGVKNQQIESLSLCNVKRSLEQKDVTWHLNPPHASHFGGAWERKIGAVRRVFEGSIAQLRGRLLNRDELTTLLLEATAIVNNTPMWEITSDPRDPVPVSPSMLLTLKDSPNPPAPESYSVADVNSYGAKRWRRVQFLAETFWQKWRTHYLSGLQERSKWVRRNRNVCKGDVVLIVNKLEKRNTWPLAIVSAVKVSKDGLVRSVVVETSRNDSRKQFERPISQIITLVPAE